MAVHQASSDFGGKLRAARERRGLSLRQVASATKISLITLEALEHNDVAKLPGGIFGRAFVRTYAAEVGLDPDIMVEEFIAQVPHGAAVATGLARAPIEDREAIESDRRMAATVLRLVLMSMLVGGAVLYLATVGRR